MQAFGRRVLRSLQGVLLGALLGAASIAFCRYVLGLPHTEAGLVALFGAFGAWLVYVDVRLVRGWMARRRRHDRDARPTTTGGGP